MKALIFLALFLYPSYSYPRDYLLEAMFNSWAYAPEAEEVREEVEEVEEYSDNSEEAESYSWDNLYLDPYADTIIIYEGADSNNTGCH
jgi:hypothetical protein